MANKQWIVADSVTLTALLEKKSSVAVVMGMQTSRTSRSNTDRAQQETCVEEIFANIMLSELLREYYMAVVDSVLR